ncbi:MAG: TnpV protein [Clostridia bacterium]|nr:TnpV protein [Clostridia bacterium]
MYILCSNSCGQALSDRLLPPTKSATSTEGERLVGVRKQRRLNYLKHHRKALYYNLHTSGKLHSHFTDIE